MQLSLVRPYWSWFHHLFSQALSQASPPSPHFEHSSAWPGPEYSPGPHSSQVPPLDEYLPASQCLQSVRPEFEVLPALHFLQSLASFPSWNLPAGHWSHVLRPLVLENLPGVHWRQISFPFEYLPAAQSTHPVRAVLDVLPEVHGKHELARPGPENCPAGHCVH